MQPVELGGLLAGAALVGGLIGGVWAAHSAKAARRAAHEKEFIQSLVVWLVARREWRMAAIRLIRRVRRLAQEPRDSDQFQRLCKSARRAGRRFRRTTHQLSLAEAVLETWRGNSAATQAALPTQPSYTQVRRAALRGGAERIELLIKRIKLADDADLEWVRTERIRMYLRR